MTTIEIVSTIVALIGGGGGIITWARFHREVKKQDAAAEREDDVARLSAKTALREAADGMAQKIWERLGSDLEAAGKRLDTARNTVEQQQQEIRELLKRLDIADRALIEAERKLAVAQAEIDRKERVVRQLQEQVAALEATVTELRKQLAECTGATGQGSD